MAAARDTAGEDQKIAVRAQRGVKMIHYHGTPFGNTKVDVARFLQGRHALVPYPRQDDLGAVAELCQSFCFDNGAFSVWKSGGSLDLEGYYRWVDDWKRHPGFDWAIVPDVIDGTDDQNIAMLDAWPHELRCFGVPVWHYSDSLDYLQHLVEQWPRIALGSSEAYKSPGSDPWTRRTNEAMQVICTDDGRPKVRLHGLRMLNPAVFTKIPLASADSTNLI